ncbi:MAG: MFS transporter [Candidatus Bipolaricaulota bacterium]|nr:MAG: MFS transporter [Candidatus Bipolaricaulota bacterium]
MALFVSVAVAMMGVGIVAPILPLLAQTFSAGGFAIGLSFSAFPLARMLVGPVIGRLSDHIGRKRLLVLGLAGFTVISILYVITSSIWQLALFRFLQGGASMLVTPIAQAYVGDVTPAGKEGRSINAFYVSMFLGMAVGPLLGGTLAEAWGFRASFLAMGALSSCALILVLWTVPPDARRVGARPRAAPTPIRTLLRSDSVKALLLYFATRGVWRQGFNAFFPLWAASRLGLSESSIGLILSTYMLSGGVLQLPFGMLADRWPRRIQVAIGSAGAPLLLLVVPYLSSTLQFAALTFTVGALSALSRASMLAIRTALGRKHGMGTLAGLHGAAFSSGQMLGPTAFGAIADGIGLSAAFPFGAAVGFAATVLVVRWLRRDRGEPAADAVS